MAVAGVAAPQTIKPRWPAVPYPMNNGTKPTSAKPDIPNAINKTPSVIPTPEYTTVDVVPATKLPPSPIHAPVPRYAGSAATLLQGYCTEPAYTIIDGPTAVWMPVVGCISSKSDCCPTSTTGGGAGAERTGEAGENPTGGSGAGDGGAQFPVSLMPSQGALTGCPKDYHTVGGTACCPSSYWLWSTSLGGQIPCYSSLDVKLTPPPIPDTLVDGGGMSNTGSITLTRSTNVPALTMSQKPTLAIVNIAFSMQYPVIPSPKPALEKKAKIGIGVGASGAGVLLAVMLWFLIRKFFAHRKTKNQLQDMQQSSVSQRFRNDVDMSRVAHEPAGVERTYLGKKYAGVSTAAVNY